MKIEVPASSLDPSEARVSPDALRRFAAEVFSRCEMSSEDATLVADSLVTADLRGTHSHGVLRVAEYVDKLQRGGVDPRGRPIVASDRQAALVVDARNSMGQVAATFAMRAAIERARQTGVAISAVRGSNHCGALDDYARLASAEDMIGLATTNALPTMAPWGGTEKLLGINPFAAAIPAGDECSISFDAAFSASSHGKIRVYQQKGLAIPEDWATDRDGHPTTDAARAIEGLLLPIGGHKGTGLALIMGILSTLLSDASFGTELGNMEDGPRPGADGHFFAAIRIESFTDITRFKRRVDGIARQLRNSRRRADCERIYLPGERELEAERVHASDGIPLNRATLESLHGVGEELGVRLETHR